MRLFYRALSLSCILVAANANAAPSEAQRLFDEAKQLADAGKWADACPKLAESMRIEPNATTEFRLADCLEHTGKLASAYTHYLATASAANLMGEATKERFARERAAKLESQVDRLQLVFPDVHVPNLTVERDGRLLPESAWRTPLPLDPGEHTVHVAASGKIPFDELVKAGATGKVHKVVVPVLDDATPLRMEQDANPNASKGLPPTANGAVTGPGPAQVPSAPASKESSSSSTKPWGIGLGVFGLAAVGTGVGLYADAKGENVPRPCGDGACVPSISLLGVGLAAIVAGTVLFLTSK